MDRLNKSPVCKTCFLRYKDEGNRDSIKICVECGSTKTPMEEISWLKSNGQVERKVVPHWYGTLDRPLCKTCYKKKYSLDQSVFDKITEDPAYWSGFLMTDGNIYKGKTGNPRISLTLAEKDYFHLVEFRKFLKCTNPILPKKKKYHGAIVIQYYLRISSKHIAGRLLAYGLVPRKSLVAKAIGLENDGHFWRGVLDGDGYFKNKEGNDGDRIFLTGSNCLCAQFEEFIIRNVPNSKVRG